MIDQAVSLIIGVILDRVFADPVFSFHPVRLIGAWIALLERQLNFGSRFGRLLLGFITVLLTVVPVGFFFAAADAALKLAAFTPLPGLSMVLWNSAFVFILLASEGLVREGRHVIDGLANSLEDGRLRLSKIVGRETAALDEEGIRRAVLESMSENLSDGVIAPLFYFAIGGVPLMAVYKAINTLDSMIGYKNDRYLYFGKFAARLDDILNFIPARLTALLLVIVSGKPSAVRSVIRFASLHESPNAGYPESALAGILGVRLGGPAVYHGVKKEKAWLGDGDRKILHEDFEMTIRLNRKSLYLMVLLILLFSFAADFFMEVQ